jgi:hypothetical protein
MTSESSEANSRGWAASLRWTIGVPTFSAIIASLATAAIFKGRVNILPENISYTDLAAVILTAVTIILAVVALAVAALAIIGWRAFMKMAEVTAKKAAVPAATGAVETYLATSAEELLVQRAEAVALRVISPDRLEQLIREQINTLLIGNPADDEMDEDDIAEEEVGDDHEH